MWQPIATAPQDGRMVWVGDSTTGQMRLAVWRKNPLIYGGPSWIDVILLKINFITVRFEPDCWCAIPEKPNGEPHGHDD